jgi:predicted DCC family thiol-disulfide oxidoreductase YuxK
VSREHGELPRDPRGAAIGARRIGGGHPDELLEVGLALHAHELVDRHRRRSVGRSPDAPQPKPHTLSVVPRAALLFNGRCGFCRRSVERILRWDRHGRLRPVALQDPEADELLGGMDEERKMASWHLVTADGTVYSAGAAFTPLLRLLPGGRPLAALTATFPGLTERAYRHVARTRGPVPRVRR